MTFDIKASIVGATGYLGGEMTRLLVDHPKVEIVSLTSNSNQGVPVWKFHPGLRGVLEKEFVQLDIENVASESDVVICAVPHGAALDIVPKILDVNDDVKVIDLSADYRIRDPNVYTEWYNKSHGSDKWLGRAVYGLPEYYFDDIKGARLVANPGCYPTSAILAMAPLLDEGVAKTDSIVVDSKSGVTGAGRKLSSQTHYPECNDSIKAYAVAGHRHTPEIEQELSAHSDVDVKINFTPHLTPMNRGILSTIYCNLKKEMSTDDVYQLYSKSYADKPFVRVLEEGTWPETRFVRGTNFCDIQMKVDVRTNRAIIVSAIDNLIKGGAGQAVQNMNIMFSLDERTGLMTTGVYI